MQSLASSFFTRPGTELKKKVRCKVWHILCLLCRPMKASGEAHDAAVPVGGIAKNAVGGERREERGERREEDEIGEYGNMPIETATNTQSSRCPERRSSLRSTERIFLLVIKRGERERGERGKMTSLERVWQ
eukprot:TRINITY_DN1638_c0_g1_i2.p1 TRINITY_DN1638_c0_g1~~TRINITY_DN1638_c0_g1_i2.p1  ORF type:complete len:132 (-),score=29.75 TRINITY_DN1638_c0_g1_i2:215-610(-)